MRLMDAVLSFPPLVLALALGAMLGAGLVGVLLALGVVYTPRSRGSCAPGAGDHGARLIRGRGAGAGRVRLAGRVAARGSERHQPDHRAGLAERRLRHSREASLSFSGSVSNRPRRPGAA